MDTFAEIRKLYAMLNEAHIPCTLAPLYDGWQVRIYADEDMTRELDDAICHSGSHGYRNGLLETYCLGGCDGWETAEQVFEGWKKMYKEAQQKG
jgi:hypothetical protein